MPEVGARGVVTGWGVFSGRLGKFRELAPRGRRLRRGWKGRFQLEKPTRTQLGETWRYAGRSRRSPPSPKFPALAACTGLRSGERLELQGQGRWVPEREVHGWAEEALCTSRVTGRRIQLSGGQSPSAQSGGLLVRRARLYAGSISGSPTARRAQLWGSVSPWPSVITPQTLRLFLLRSGWILKKAVVEKQGENS